jgi:hypothetical protein
VVVVLSRLQEEPQEQWDKVILEEMDLAPIPTQAEGVAALAA